jgi:hypothetical protein
LIPSSSELVSGTCTGTLTRAKLCRASSGGLEQIQFAPWARFGADTERTKQDLIHDAIKLRAAA